MKTNRKNTENKNTPEEKKTNLITVRVSVFVNGKLYRREPTGVVLNFAPKQNGKSSSSLRGIKYLMTAEGFVSEII